MWRTVRTRLVNCRRGNFGVIAALAFPALAGAAGAAVDYNLFSTHKTQLVAVVDSATLAAASEARVHGWDTAIAKEVAKNYIESNLAEASLATAQYSVDVQVSETDKRIDMRLS